MWMLLSFLVLLSLIWFDVEQFAVSGSCWYKHSSIHGRHRRLQLAYTSEVCSWPWRCQSPSHLEKPGTAIPNRNIKVLHILQYRADGWLSVWKKSALHLVTCAGWGGGTICDALYNLRYKWGMPCAQGINLRTQLKSRTITITNEHSTFLASRD